MRRLSSANDEPHTISKSSGVKAPRNTKKMILTTFLLIVAAIVTLAGLGLYFGQQLGLLFLLTSFTIMLVTGMYLIGGSSINIPTGDEHYAYNQTTGDYTVTTYTENNNWFDKIVGWTFTFGD